MWAIIFSYLFFEIPLLVFALFGISLYKYLSAKRRSRQENGTIDEKELSHHKTVLIITSVIAAVIAAVFIGFIVLLNMSVAFM